MMMMVMMMSDAFYFTFGLQGWIDGVVVWMGGGGGRSVGRSVDGSSVVSQSCSISVLTKRQQRHAWRWRALSRCRRDYLKSATQLAQRARARVARFTRSTHTQHTIAHTCSTPSRAWRAPPPRAARFCLRCRRCCMARFAPRRIILRAHIPRLARCAHAFARPFSAHVLARARFCALLCA